MATYNTFSLPFQIPTNMVVGQVYALLAIPSKLLASTLLTFSTTYAGTYASLANSNVGPNGCDVNAGFVKCSAPTSVTIKRNSFKK